MKAFHFFLAGWPHDFITCPCVQEAWLLHFSLRRALCKAASLLVACSECSGMITHWFKLWSYYALPVLVSLTTSNWQIYIGSTVLFFLKAIKVLTLARNLLFELSNGHYLCSQNWCRIKLAWDAKDLGSIPCSTGNFLCNLRPEPGEFIQCHMDGCRAEVNNECYNFGFQESGLDSQLVKLA